MRIFVTGASGFVGSAIVPELLGAGHEVVGLARSDASAATVEAAGADVHRGSLEDLDGLREAATASDGVIHTAFIHDFANIDASGRVDLDVVEAMGDALAGSGKPLVVTSGTAHLPAGVVGTEEHEPDREAAATHRIPSEDATLALADRGVRSSIVRLAPSVHGEGDHAFVPFLIELARAKGVSGYIGEGANRWPAVHRLDAARLFRLAAESGAAGSVFHGADEEGIPTREIAVAIGRGLDVPVESIPVDEAQGHFAWLAGFFALDAPTSSALTRSRLNWQPTHPGLIADLAAGHYFSSATPMATSQSDQAT